MKFRPLFSVLIRIFAISGLIFLQGCQKQTGKNKDKNNHSEVEAITIGGPFTLVNHSGETVTEKDFLGKPFIVYFGYSYCPDVCPTSLQVMKLVLDSLGDKKKSIQPVFISVDPDRDTPEFLSDYVHSNGFPEGLIGLTGSPGQIRAITNAYKVYYSQRESEDTNDYLVDHTSLFFVMDKEGRFSHVFSPTSSVEEMVKRLKEFLKTQ